MFGVKQAGNARRKELPKPKENHLKNANNYDNMRADSEQLYHI